ncbi:MAG: YibE/F family protein [Pyramidobacter sp.]|uniref:YibE/F family protein n=1 Tax=Pyramidobacter sp. TaxID=1943581 RepID=UPI002A83DADB|nr:YibE/F family protein [Pyramidobacter sp.]MDY4032465.1 YibE/F family protein [Pyramidobacter sp.]
MQKNRRRAIVFWAALILITAVCALGVGVLGSVEKTELISRAGQSFEKGVVTEILEDNLQPDGTRAGNQLVRVLMTSGVKRGQELETTSSSGFLFGAPCRPGMKVVVMQSVAGDTVISSVYSQDREHVVYLFAALYLAALVLVGGLKGLKGALGLVFTFFAIIFAELPLVYRGYSPTAAAVFICCVTTFVTMLLIGGFSQKTLIATAGTVAGVLGAWGAARLFSAASGISGWNVSNIESLMTLWHLKDIQVGELLFAGLLISTLGAVMDVAMSIASAMQEIQRQNPAISRRELFRAGIRVGRDMMGTDANTLILAFSGSSLGTLMLDYAYDLPYLQIINSNNIGIAIMQGLGGSFGIVLSVPFTVALGSFLLTAASAETRVPKTATFPARPADYSFRRCK